MRGDLIDTFKIVNGLTNYGRDWFTFSSRTNHLISGTVLKSIFSSVNFFANRVVKYYNLTTSCPYMSEMLPVLLVSKNI